MDYLMKAETLGTLIIQEGSYFQLKWFTLWDTSLLLEVVQTVFELSTIGRPKHKTAPFDLKLSF